MTKQEYKPIKFSEEEEPRVNGPCNDLFLSDIVIIDVFSVSSVLIDSGSVVNIMFRSCHRKLKRSEKKLVQDHEPLLSFSGDIVQLLRSDMMSV